MWGQFGMVPSRFNGTAHTGVTQSGVGELD